MFDLLIQVCPAFWRMALLIGWVSNPVIGFSQPFSLHVQPVFSGKKIVLEQAFRGENGDTLAVQTLKFYLGNFEFRKNGYVVFAEKTYRLIDLEDEKSLALVFNFPEKATFDSLYFDLGTDSLTNSAGVMGGDLDPARGMFWTWQSGYINLKLEGFSSRCPARAGMFMFHLGGFLPPFQTVRRVVLPFSKPVNSRINFDLAPFFQSVDWAQKPGIMSPGMEAVRLMDVLAAGFHFAPDRD